MRQAEAAEAGGEGGSGSDGKSQEEGDQARLENTVGEDEGGQGNRFARYASLGGANDDTNAFKWNFVTNKLAELKSKSAAKSN